MNTFLARKPEVIFLTLCLLPSTVSPLSRFPYDAVARLAMKLMYGSDRPPPPLIPRNPTMYKTTEEIARYYGYPFEAHQVMSEDGYTTVVHRIPHNRFSEMTKNEPVLLVHGLFMDSSSYVMNGDINSLGLGLSAAGYDVWMTNNRGSRFSRKHNTLLPDTQEEFWDFSFHEMGVYDLPATVDLILSVTKKKQIYIMGQSMGCTIIGAFLASSPSYAPKIKAAFLMAQGILMGRTGWSLPRKMPCLSRLILSFFHGMDLLSYSEDLQKMFGHLFHQNPVIHDEIVHMAFGDSQETNGLVPMIDLTKCVSGTSIKVMEHFLQIIATGNFTHFDYGPEDNMRRYGQKSPPKYDLENITVPVSISYADDDDVAAPEDAILLNRTLKNLLPMIHITHKKFGHHGFIMSPFLKNYVIDPIVDQMTMLEEMPFEKSTKLLDYLLIVSLFVMALSLLIAFLQLMPYTRKIEYTQFEKCCQSLTL